MKKTASTE